MYEARQFWRAQAAEDVGAGWGMMPCSRSIKKGSAQGCTTLHGCAQRPRLDTVRSPTTRSRSQSRACCTPGWERWALEHA